MISRLRSYPAYKDSGVEWLGKVPVHWSVIRGKWLFDCIDVRSTSGDEELLTVSSERGIIPRSDATVTMFKAESYKGYKLCWPGDLVINSLWAWARGLGVSQHHGIVSSAYGVYRLKEPYHEYTGYLHRLVRSLPFNYELHVRSKGIWVSRLQLTDEAFLDAPFSLPGRHEQTAIVRFLDHIDRRIQRYIHAKQKLLSLLEEQKQAIIHQAVTGQIDVRTGKPYPAYKPSGVKWLEEVPTHWEIRRLRTLIIGRLTYGANAAAEHNDTTWPRYLRITDFSKNGKLRTDTFRSLPPDIANDYLVEPGDVLLARSGATVGKSFLVDEQAGTACHAGYLIRARLNRKLLDPSLFFAFTQSAGFERWKDSVSIIATIQNISAEKYSDLAVPVPPRSEQDNIKQFVRAKEQTIDRAVHVATEEIVLLQEYRTRLITDVVTGKLDVREVALELPDDADVLEPSDGVGEPHRGAHI